MWLCCAQNGGVVSMSDGAVTFKGGTITNTTATVSTGHDGCWHVCPRCGMLANGMWRSVRRTLHGVAAVDGSFELCGVPHIACPIWYATGSVWHDARRCALSVASHVLCHVADGTLPGASFFCGWNAAWRIVLLAEPGSGLSTGIAVGTRSGVRGSGLTGWWFDVVGLGFVGSL